MKQVQDVIIEPFDVGTYGLLQSRRRLARVYFVDALPVDESERVYPALLPDVYERIARSQLGPPSMPGKLRAEWSDDERAFVLRGRGLCGFRVVVLVENVREQAAVEATESAVEAVHGSPLPRLRL